MIQQPDGHWRWLVNGPDGEPLAESPAVYRDAAACGRALSAALAAFRRTAGDVSVA